MIMTRACRNEALFARLHSVVVRRLRHAWWPLHVDRWSQGSFVGGGCDRLPAKLRTHRLLRVHGLMWSGAPTRSWPDLAFPYAYLAYPRIFCAPQRCICVRAQLPASASLSYVHPCLAALHPMQVSRRCLPCADRIALATHDPT